MTVELGGREGTLAGFVREPIGAELRFRDVLTNSTFVSQALEEFDQLVRAFPVR